MVNLLVHSIHELTTKLCYKLMMIKRHVVDPLKFFFLNFYKKKKKKKVSCYEDKVFTSNNWMSVLANMGKYHNDKCMHLSKEWKSRNMIIVSIQKKKKKKMIMSGCLFSKRFVRLSFQKANLLYLTLSFISRIIAPCVNFNQNRDETTSGYSFFFLIGTSG